MTTKGHILVLQQIRALVAAGGVRREGGPREEQIQPASLDLTLGRRGWRVRTGFLCEDRTVADRLAELALFELDLAQGAVLEVGHPYILELAERFDLPGELQAHGNPRSSTGRLDLFTRIVADRWPRFDGVPPGYRGPLYLEVVPRSFPVRLRQGLSLNQIRFFTGDPRLTDGELLEVARREPLARDEAGRPIPPEELLIDGGLILRVGLEAPAGDPPIVGYKARRYSGIVDLARRGAHRKEDYWEALPPPPDRSLILEPEVFYLLASREQIQVPRDLAAEMVAFDVGLGELRTHYAGFFDNGFGPARAVLEVRPHDVPFLVEHGQALFRLEYFRTNERPERLYGESALGSGYQAQGLALSRHFA